MRCAWGMVLALLILGAGPPPSDKLWSREDRDAKAEGLRLYDSGAFTQAIPFFDAVLTRHPRDLDSRRKRGACFLQIDQPERALADFDAVIGYDAGYPGAWTNRGNALLMLNQNEPALEAFQTAISAYQAGIYLPRQRVAPYAGLGEAFYQLGRFDLSFQAYDMVVRLDPRNLIGMRGRMRALVAQGQPGGGAPRTGDREQVRPAPADGPIFRGSTLAAQGRNDEALADFNQALQNDPSDPLLWKNRGGLLVRMGRAEEALRDLNEAIRLDPKLASAYQNRGAAYNCLSQYEKAAKDLEEAIRLDPKSVGAHNNLGLALSALGSADRAVLEFSEAIRLGASNASVFVNRGLAYERLGVVDASARDFTDALRHDSQSSLAREGLRRLQKAEVAQTPERSGGEMSMPLPSSPVESIVSHAVELQAAGDLPGAIRGFSEAIQRETTRADSYASRAQARLMAGENGGGDDARDFITLSRWASPSSASVAILGALAYRREGRMGEAERLLDEALANTPPDRWPYPALLYLRGRLDATGMMARAGSESQKAEAQALIGLSLGLAGDREGAAEPLRRAVSDRQVVSGSKIVEVADAALKQIE